MDLIEAANIVEQFIAKPRLAAEKLLEALQEASTLEQAVRDHKTILGSLKVEMEGEKVALADAKEAYGRKVKDLADQMDEVNAACEARKAEVSEDIKSIEGTLCRARQAYAEELEALTVAHKAKAGEYRDLEAELALSVEKLQGDLRKLRDEAAELAKPSTA